MPVVAQVGTFCVGRILLFACLSIHPMSLLCVDGGVHPMRVYVYSIECSIYVLFGSSVRSVCVGLLVDAQVGAFCVVRILPFACPRVTDVLFFEEADASSAVDFLHIRVRWICGDVFIP